MRVLLISVCGLFFGCHGLSLSAGESPQEERQEDPSRNDDLWESINMVVDWIKPQRAARTDRRSSLGERPRRKRRGKKGSRMDADSAAPANGTSADAGVRAKVAAAVVNNSTKAPGNATEPTRTLFGGHHKAGVRMLESMQEDFVYAMHVPKREVTACPKFTSVEAGSVVRPCQLNIGLYRKFMALPGRKRVLHVTRDPFKFVLAGYVYHSIEDDGIFSVKKGKAKSLDKMSVKAGLEMFANFAITHWLKDMVEVHNAIKADDVDALTVRLEDFSKSESDFDAMSATVYQFLSDGDDAAATKMLQTATKFDLFNRTKEFVKQASVSLPEKAHSAYKHMAHLPNNVTSALLEMRYQLGYNID